MLKPDTVSRLPLDTSLTPALAMRLGSMAVAKERITKGDSLVVEAEIGEWEMKQEERRLFAGAEAELPRWRLADKARRMLADLVWHFADHLPQTKEFKVTELKPADVRRAAVVSAGGIAVRAAGSVLVLLSAGYGPESASSLRRLLEAKLNVQAILDDATGEYGVRYLQAKPRGITKLAQKYGNAEEIEILSMLTHANVAGLLTLDIEDPSKARVSMKPFHRAPEAEFLLLSVAYECGLMCTDLADVFEVTFQMPAWVSGQLDEMCDWFGQDPRQPASDKSKR